MVHVQNQLIGDAVKVRARWLQHARPPTKRPGEGILGGQRELWVLQRCQAQRTQLLPLVVLATHQPSVPRVAQQPVVTRLVGRAGVGQDRVGVVEEEVRCQQRHAQ
jgi:hypothetical protein